MKYLADPFCIIPLRPGVWGLATGYSRREWIGVFSDAELLTHLSLSFHERQGEHQRALDRVNEGKLNLTNLNSLLGDLNI